MKSAIAIVGMACVYPDARSPIELWENVLAKRRAFRRIPPERLRLEDYHSSDRNAPDLSYASHAAVIDGYVFDREKFRVVGSTYRSADLVHWLALDVASRALDDAGFHDGRGIPTKTTGVLIGNTLTGEFSRAATMRLRWPYVRRVLDAQLASEGWTPEKRTIFLSGLEVRYKEPFPEVGDESLSGGLSNTIAGRICNHFDFKGGGYTLDGACSSSLLALANGCSALQTGDLDAALVGGVDLSLDPFELVGFSKLGALAEGEMRVYDRDATGFLPGEGCGFVLLMRDEDALALGLRPYAMIKGWGISSDGEGGITRPEVEGQRLALERAYQRSGYGIDTVRYFEGHGTGTPIGDTVELRTLSLARQAAQAKTPAAIGSIKANIGHTKAAAGIAGVIKAVMALSTQILPPTTGVKIPHPEFDNEGGLLQVQEDGEVWPVNCPLRAGVSSFGFGGINVHISLESSEGRRRKEMTEKEKILLSSVQDTELFFIGAEDVPGLLSQVTQIQRVAPGLSQAELGDLAAALAEIPGPFRVRAALLASTPAELEKHLEILHNRLTEGITQQIDPVSGTFIGTGHELGRIAFLFPGQASPVCLNGGMMERRFTRIRDLYHAASLVGGGNLGSTAVAQPAIITAELAGLRLMSDLGIEAFSTVGHSVGELAALSWAGVLSEEDVLEIAKVRGRVMSEVPGPAGAMASIAAPCVEVKKLLREFSCFEKRVVIACLNAPMQTVISGETEAVEHVARQASARGYFSKRLPVSSGFHSALMNPAAEGLETYLRTLDFRPLGRRFVSTVTGRVIEKEEDFRNLLKRQLTMPVRFTETMAEMVDGIDLFIEVGPGAVLSGLIGSWIKKPVISLDIAGASLRGLLQGIGAAYALGSSVRRKKLFSDRFTRPFDLERRPRFFTNPCELAPLPEEASSVKPISSLTNNGSGNGHFKTEPVVTNGKVPGHAPHSDETEAEPLELLRQLVATRLELPIDIVLDESRLLEDLHLNSISVAQIMAEATRKLGLQPPTSPTDYSKVSLNDAAAALGDLIAIGTNGVGEDDLFPSGVDGWVRAYTLKMLETPLSGERQSPEGQGKWQCFAPPGHPVAAPLLKRLEDWGRSGVLVCLPPEPDEAELDLLLQGAKAALKDAGSPGYFVLVQEGGGAASFTRTLSLEAQELTTCVVVDVPQDSRASDWVFSELETAVGYKEVTYDVSGRRFEPSLELLPFENTANDLYLGPEDLLLVSGGGKGIAAESALALARETGVRLALLGRARPEEDQELADNLKRLSENGITFRYLAADVSNLKAVREAVKHVEAEFGSVTALLHGAGINRPRLLKDLDLSVFSETLAAKVTGFRNLIAAVDPEKLRLLVSFGSIIARTGMRGEADYALANAWLTRLTEQFQKTHPDCRCLSIEWSVWSGVGMGERLGRIDALVREGIGPIPPDKGIAILRHLVSARPPAVAVVVTGRLGSFSMFQKTEKELPFRRFLEQCRVYYPGVELVVDAEISDASDLYLTDHVFQGERLFPAVMGLEAMAQVAMALADADEAPQFEEVEFLHPVVIPEGKTVTLRVAALVRRPGFVELVLRSGETAFQVDHFRAVCRFGEEITAAASSQMTEVGLFQTFQGKDTNQGEHTGSPLHRIKAMSDSITIDPELDLYGDLLFQSGRFKRLSAYRRLFAKECLADISEGDSDAWFTRYLPGDLILGDPGSRDAAMHGIQACIPHAVILPIGVERIIPAQIHTPGPWTLHAVERWHEGETFCYDLEMRGKDGTLRERWEGLRLRNIVPYRQKKWPEALLLPFLERRLEELVPGGNLSIGLLTESKAGRRERSDRAILQALGETLKITRRSDGKPEVDGGRAVSSAHAGDLTLAIAGADPTQGSVACDLERIVARSEEVWHDLLGAARWELATLIAQKSSEEIDVAATRVWMAIECLKKGGLMMETPLVWLSSHNDTWVLLGAGDLQIATYVVTLKDDRPPIGMGFLVGRVNVNV